MLATQCLVAKKMKNMLVKVEGRLPAGVTAKDIVLAVIGRIGTAGGNGHAIEFAGSAIRDPSIEGRMTICNMSIEAGARVGLVAVDQKTIDYVKGRPFAPSAEQWDQAVACWQGLVSDADARFDTVVELDAAQIKPQVSWGTSPEMVLAVDQNVPDPARESDPIKRGSIERALNTWACGRTRRSPTSSWTGYSSVPAPTRGSRTCAPPPKWPGAGRRDHQAGVGAGFRVGQEQAEKEGLDRIFIEAGFEWREPGCSMCLAMNPDRLESGEHCASTSNRNFEGRQGAGGRTHLVSPAMRRRGRQRPLHRCPRIARLRRTEMKPYTQTTGLVAPLDRANVDTDQIIPKQFLKSIKRTGFGPNLFDEWRYLDVGQPGQDNSKRPLNPDFVLNQPRTRAPAYCWRGRTSAAARPRARALGAGRVRFPHGDRTELCRHLLQQQFQERLAADHPAEAEVDELFRQVEANEGYQLSIDLAAQTVTRPDGKVLGFEVDPFRKHCLLNGPTTSA